MSTNHRAPPEEGGRKTPYCRPRLRVIDLLADEVLGVGCKSDTGTAPFANPCQANNCREWVLS